MLSRCFFQKSSILYRLNAWTVLPKKVKCESESHSIMSNSLRPRGLYSPWNSPGQNAGVGSLSFPSLGDLPNPGIEPRSPALQADSLPTELSGKPIFYHTDGKIRQLSHKGNPRILKWVAYPFSSRSSQPRNQTRVSCIAGGFFTNWAIREAHISPYRWENKTAKKSLWSYSWEIAQPVPLDLPDLTPALNSKLKSKGLSSFEEKLFLMVVSVMLQWLIFCSS